MWPLADLLEPLSCSRERQATVFGAWRARDARLECGPKYVEGRIARAAIHCCSILLDSMLYDSMLIRLLHLLCNKQPVKLGSICKQGREILSFSDVAGLSLMALFSILPARNLTMSFTFPSSFPP